MTGSLRLYKDLYATTAALNYHVSLRIAQLTTMLSVRSCLAASAALTCTVINGVHAFPTAQGERASTSSKYDFVIVGGKQFLDLPIAGIFIEVLQEALLDAMGVRLSEDASTNVLVLEAGPFPEVIKPYMTPGASQQVLGMLDFEFALHPPGVDRTSIQVPNWTGDSQHQRKKA